MEYQIWRMKKAKKKKLEVKDQRCVHILKFWAKSKLYSQVKRDREAVSSEFQISIIGDYRLQ